MKVHHTNEISCTNVYPILSLLHIHEPEISVHMHRRHLLVHTWSFRNEQRSLASDYVGNPVYEYLQFYKLGVDGVFSAFADTAVAARVLYELENNPDAADCLTGEFEIRWPRAVCNKTHWVKNREQICFESQGIVLHLISHEINCAYQM
jgi:hypothetical protein